MQQHKNLQRLLRALARQGLDVSYENQTYSVRFQNSPDAPAARVLLPAGLTVEAKALKQLALSRSPAIPMGVMFARYVGLPIFTREMPGWRSVR